MLHSLQVSHTCQRQIKKLINDQKTESMKNTMIFAFVVFLYGCDSEKNKAHTSPIDYDQYLNTQVSSSKDVVLSEISFWQSRFKNDSTKVVELGKLSGLHSALFSTTGDISELYKSEKLLKKAIQISARKKDSYMRALAHNYISQHRFKEAKILLDSAYVFSDNKRETEFMLFDVSMELGDYQTADVLLRKLKNNKDYNYLIRLSKWSDYKGNLDAAIRYMEQAKSIVESRGVADLKIWIYTNIADYYGHAGRIKDAYSYYLKALELQPDNAYAKKGIAWIAYASEGNTSEANRILDSVMMNHKAPGYYLLKAEMAEFNEDPSEAKKQQENFVNKVEYGSYGNIYNTYLIELYAETKPEKAMELAKTELENRATPETFQLLAYVHLKMGNSKEALRVIEDRVVGKTFEPMALYYSALIYKVNGLNSKVAELKKKLKTASFELGPVMMRQVDRL